MMKIRAKIIKKFMKVYFFFKVNINMYKLFVAFFSLLKSLSINYIFEHKLATFFPQKGAKIYKGKVKSSLEKNLSY